MENNRARRKRSIFCIIALACLMLATGACGDANISGDETEVSGSAGGVDGILIDEDGNLPAVFYQGEVYQWVRLYYDPNRRAVPDVLPEKFEYIGDIAHITKRDLTEDLQFSSWFDVEGAAYRSEDSPDIIVIYLTNMWIEDPTAIVFHSDIEDYYSKLQGLSPSEFYTLMDQLFPYP